MPPNRYVHPGPLRWAGGVGILPKLFAPGGVAPCVLAHNTQAVRRFTLRAPRRFRPGRRQFTLTISRLCNSPGVQRRRQAGATPENPARPSSKPADDQGVRGADCRRRKGQPSHAQTVRRTDSFAEARGAGTGDGEQPDRGRGTAAIRAPWRREGEGLRAMQSPADGRNEKIVPDRRGAFP
jgi:hypothetical protein